MVASIKPFFCDKQLKVNIHTHGWQQLLVLKCCPGDVGKHIRLPHYQISYQRT